MRKRRCWRALLGVFCFFLLVPLAVQANWEQVGQAGFYAGGWPNLAVDSNGTPYVSYMDWGYSQKASVMKFFGGRWQQAGQAGFSVDKVYHTCLAIDSSGTPYVSYDGSKASVKKFNSTTSNWDHVGPVGFTAGAAHDVSLAIDSSDTPYVAYHDDYNGFKVSVVKFNSATSNWDHVGPAGFSASQANDISLAIDGSDTPYVAYSDQAKIGKASVKKFNSATLDWDYVGPAGFSAGYAFMINLAIDSSGTPYIAYMDYANGSKVSVMKFNSVTSNWDHVGPAGFSIGHAFSINLVIDSSDTPYVAYQDYGNGYKGSVMKFNSATSNWDYVGPAGFSASQANDISLVIDGSDTPYVAYNDQAKGNRISVMKFVSTVFNQIPVSNAGDNQSIIQGETVCFDGSGSTDPDGDALTYLWTLTTQPAGSMAILNDETDPAPCMTIDTPGSYIVSLIVNDGTVDSNPSTAEVVAISYLDALTEILQQAVEAVNSLDDDTFDNKNNRKNLTKGILEVIALVDQELYAEALLKLEGGSVLGKTDGCAAEEGAPDSDDWIIDCESQDQVYPLLYKATEYLKDMM